MVDSLRAHNKSFALIDLGDWMNSEMTVGEEKSRFIWKTMEQMGYLLTPPGVRELDRWQLYRELIAQGPIQCVSSNLSVVEGGAESPIAPATRVLEIGGVRVGFFALMGGNEITTARPPDGIEYRTQDALATAQKLVPELRKDAEIVVLMSQMSTQETDDLVRRVPGIDVALYGRNAQWKERAEKVAASIAQQTGMRGQFTGELALIVDPDGRIVDWGSRNTTLDVNYPENVDLAAAIKQAESRAKEALKLASDKKASEIEGKITSERYIGVDKCQRCHEAEHAQWAGTKHARAFATLEKDGTQADEKCVGCHVTGWKRQSGYAAGSSDPDLRNVQCEACHDMGTLHSRTNTRPIREETCLVCHTGEWGKGFSFASDLAKVTH